MDYMVVTFIGDGNALVTSVPEVLSGKVIVALPNLHADATARV